MMWEMECCRLFPSSSNAWILKIESSVCFCSRIFRQIRMTGGFECRLRLSCRSLLSCLVRMKFTDLFIRLRSSCVRIRLLRWGRKLGSVFITYWKDYTTSKAGITSQPLKKTSWIHFATTLNLQCAKSTQSSSLKWCPSTATYFSTYFFKTSPLSPQIKSSTLGSSLLKGSQTYSKTTNSPSRVPPLLTTEAEATPRSAWSAFFQKRVKKDPSKRKPSWMFSQT